MRSKNVIRLSLLLAVFRLITEMFVAATCSIWFGLLSENDVCAACVFLSLTVCAYVWVCVGIKCGLKSLKSNSTLGWPSDMEIVDIVPYPLQQRLQNEVNTKDCYRHWHSQLPLVVSHRHPHTVILNHVHLPKTCVSTPSLWVHCAQSVLYEIVHFVNARVCVCACVCCE